MKRFRVTALMLFAFVVGFVSTYNCGGGGSSSNAADYAPLVHQHDAADITSGELGINLIPSHSHSDYALTDHSHDDYADSQHIHDSGDLLDGGIHNIHITGRAAIAGTAETLDGMDSTDFAEASHTHDSSDITGTINANTMNGFTATTIDALIQAVCMINRQTGNIIPLPDEVDPLCYQYVFVTSTTYNGNLGALNGANALCQAHAEAAGLPGVFRAWMSNAGGNNPAVLFVQSPYPYTLIDGTIVAHDWADLTDGTLDHAINLDEFGATVTGSGVWTNTSSSGTPADPTDDCDNWTTSVSWDGVSGDLNATSSTWTDNTSTQCQDALRLYCFQQ